MKEPSTMSYPEFDAAPKRLMSASSATKRTQHHKAQRSQGGRDWKRGGRGRDFRRLFFFLN
jgi:hypothetical protein